MSGQNIGGKTGECNAMKWKPMEDKVSKVEFSSIIY